MACGLYGRLVLTGALARDPLTRAFIVEAAMKANKDLRGIGAAGMKKVARYEEAGRLRQPARIRRLGDLRGVARELGTGVGHAVPSDDGCQLQRSLASRLAKSDAIGQWHSSH